MGETAAKKELRMKKAKLKQEKAERKRDRKENNNKGKGLDEMMAYLDENGNLSETPLDEKKKKVIKAEDINLSPTRIPSEPVEVIRTGIVTYFNESKGYGFITDSISKENVFVHINEVKYQIKERDTVTFETERSPKGLSAVRVAKSV